MRKLSLVASLFLSSIIYASPLYAQLFKSEFTAGTAATDYTPIQFRLEADFKHVLELKQQDDGMGENPAQLYVSAKLIDMQNHKTYSAQIKARGNSILTDPEVDFPKLKVEIEKEIDLTGSIFNGSRKFRMNTHISSQKTKDGRTTFGRLIGDNAPVREGLAYQIAKAMGLITPRVQLADVTYVDATQNKTEVHKALILETDGSLAKRYNGEEVIDFSEVQTDQRTAVAPQEGALFMMVHKLLGNEDFALRMYEPDTMQTEKNRHLWNTFLVKLPNGTYRPVVYDLDLATIVTGRNTAAGKNFISKEFGLDSPEKAYFAAKFSLLRQKHPHTELVRAANTIVEKQNLIRELIQNYPVDQAGKDLALAHLDRFVQLARPLLEISVIASLDARFYSKANLKSKQKVGKISSEDDQPFPLRPGTPVKILGEENGFYKVVIIDGDQDLASGQNAIGYIEKSVKIYKELPIELVGYIDERIM